MLVVISVEYFGVEGGWVKIILLWMDVIIVNGLWVFKFIIDLFVEWVMIILSGNVMIMLVVEWFDILYVVVL